MTDELSMKPPEAVVRLPLGTIVELRKSPFFGTAVAGDRGIITEHRLVMSLMVPECSGALPIFDVVTQSEIDDGSFVVIGPGTHEELTHYGQERRNQFYAFQDQLKLCDGTIDMRTEEGHEEFDQRICQILQRFPRVSHNWILSHFKDPTANQRLASQAVEASLLRLTEAGVVCSEKDEPTVFGKDVYFLAGDSE